LNVSFVNKIDSLKTTLKELHNFIIPKVANKWYELGIQLLNPSQILKLDEIQSSYSTDFW